MRIFTKYVSKALLIFTGVLFLLNSAICQVPQKFNYQAVIRNNKGEIIANTNVGVRISILQNDQIAVYEEELQIKTNAFGLINLQIGDEGEEFSSINWSEGSYSLKLEIDEEGGYNYKHIGTSSLLSVPYAIASKTAENVFSGDYNDLKNIPGDIKDGDTDTHLTDDEILAMGYVKSSDDADADSNNEIQDLALNESNNILKITKNGLATEIDLSKYLDNTDSKLSDADITAMGFIKSADDADADVNNEIQDLELNESTNILTITKNGLATEVDLSKYLDDTDTHITDAEISALGFIKNGNDADSDSYNEIQDLSLNALTNILTITKNGTATEIDLSKYLDDTDTKLSDADITALGYVKSSEDADADANNEIQDLSLNTSTNILSITKNGSATEIDLSKYLNIDTKLTDADIASMGYVKSSNDADADSNNEIQDLNLNNATNILTITKNGSATEIDLNKYLDNTDTRLTDAEITAMGYIKSANDGDFDSNNEIQDLSLNSTTNILTITKNGLANEIDLSKYLDNTDTKLTDLEITGMGYIKSADDADADESNEIQELTISGNVISLSKGGGSVDLSSSVSNVNGQHYLGEEYLGGIVFYLYTGEDGKQHGYVVSTTKGGNLMYCTDDTWVNATSVWNGKSNTDAMVNSPAKKFVEKLGDDWYIPAPEEFELLFANYLHVLKTIEEKKYEKFYRSTQFWTSREALYTNATMYQNASENKLYNYPKQLGYSVIGIRQF